MSSTGTDTVISSVFADGGVTTETGCAAQFGVPVDVQAPPSDEVTSLFGTR